MTGGRTPTHERRPRLGTLPVDMRGTRWCRDDRGRRRRGAQQYHHRTFWGVP